MNLDSLPIERVKVLSAASSSSFLRNSQLDVSARYMTLFPVSASYALPRALQEIQPDNVNNEKAHQLKTSSIHMLGSPTGRRPNRQCHGDVGLFGHRGSERSSGNSEKNGAGLQGRFH